MTLNERNYIVTYFKFAFDKINYHLLAINEINNLLDFYSRLSSKVIITISVIVTSYIVIFPISSVAEVKKILVYENDSVVNSQQIIVQMYVVNNSTAPVKFIPDKKINGLLKTKDKIIEQAVPVTLNLIQGSEEDLSTLLGEKQSNLFTYRIEIQEKMTGLYSLYLNDGTSNSVLILIEEKQVLTADKSIPVQSTTENTIDLDLPANNKREENENSFLSNFSSNEPVYFIYGGQRSNAKFQVSFKYRFVDEKGSIAQYAPWASGLHLGYTQTAFWDLASESSPFIDTIFKPTIFYQHSFSNSELLPPSSNTTVNVGFEHHSNGKGGLESRSLNLGFVEPHTTFSLGNNIELDIKARAWVYLADLSDNPDIRDFRGNTSISIGIGNPEALMLTSELRGNPGTGKGNLEFNLSYPLDRIFYNNLDLYLFGQLYTGYGESLIDYNRKDTRLRFGIALQR